MKKIMKAFLIAGMVDLFYGHFVAIWRHLRPKDFNDFFEAKDEFYEHIGIDKLWKTKD